MENMEQFIQNILIGVRRWVNGKLEDLSFVISSHINELTTRMGTAETNINNKVDKVEGKGLSTEDYTTAEKTKLGNIEAGAQVNDLESISAADASVTVGAVDANKNQTVAVKIDPTAGNALQLVQGQGLRVEIPAATVTGVKSGEKIIGLDGTELTSTLSIDLVDGATAGQKFIRLLGIPGEGGTENVVDTVDVSSLVTDGMLEAAGFYRYHAAADSVPAYWEKVSGDEIAGHGSSSEATTWSETAVDGQEYIVLKWNTAAASKMTFINAAGLIDDYTAGTGLSLSNRQFTLKTASTNEIGGVTVASDSTISNTSGAIDVKLAATDAGIAKDNTGALYIPIPTVAQVISVLNDDSEDPETNATTEGTEETTNP